VGVTLALVFRRLGLPSVLLLLGCGLLLLTMLAVVAVQAYLIPLSGVEWERYARLNRVVGIAGTVARAVGLALVIAAVIVGRARARSDRADPS